MDPTSASPAPDFAKASAWLAGAPESVRTTVARHLDFHKLTPANGQLTEHRQIDLIEKALGEHHAALLPDFRHAYGTGAAPLPPEHLGYMARKLIGAEDRVLREHAGIAVVGLDSTLGYATLAMPAYLATQKTATNYARQIFNSHTVNATASAINGHFQITLPVYDLKRDVDRLKKPVGFRAMPTHHGHERLLMEEEFRVLMGKEAPPRERDMEALVQDVGMKAALQELTKDYHLMFTQNLRDGIYVFPIKTPDTLIARSAEALLATGALSENDTIFTGQGNTRKLHITPYGLGLLQEALFHGIQTDKGYVPSITSHDAQKARLDYFHAISIDDAERDLLKHELKQMTQAERAQVSALLAGKDTAGVFASSHLPEERAALKTVTNTVERVVSARDAKTAPGAPHYDQQALRRALAYAQTVLKEDRLWVHLDNAQLASRHNTIREDHSASLAQLDDMLANQPLSQTALASLVAMPRFADAIRDSGHFLSVIAQHNDTVATKTGKEQYNNGAADYARAFHLNETAMLPQSDEAKSASYHLRAMTGDVGFGEVMKRNIFMGLRPIFSSVELAVKKPVLCGATILGIAAYSSVVPKQYSIPRMLNNMMHQIIEGLGIPHGEESKGGQKLEKLARTAIEDAKLAGKNASFLRGLSLGRKLGVGQTAAIGASAFVLFNLVEDVIVHLPLALVSVGVGAAGGATGRKVLAPVFNDLGDLAGRFAPEPVREAWRSDMKAFKSAAQEPWLQRVKQGVKTFGHDVDELGLIVTGRHVLGSAVDGLTGLVGSVAGKPQTIAAAPSVAR